MKDKPRITLRGLAALAAAAAGLPARGRVAPAQEPLPAPDNPESRLRRAAAQLDRCPVTRDTQPAVLFVP